MEEALGRVNGVGTVELAWHQNDASVELVRRDNCAVAALRSWEFEAGTWVMCDGEGAVELRTTGD